MQLMTAYDPNLYDYTAGQGKVRDALADFREAFVKLRIAYTMARQDFAGRYKGTALGGLWITVTTAMTALGLGLLYSQIFGHSIREHLPYVAVGIVVWATISTLLLEGATSFVGGSHTFKQMRAPLSLFLLRVFIRNFFVFCFRALILLPLLSVTTRPGLSDYALAALGLATLYVSGFWVAVGLGVLTARFRDVGQLTGAATTFLFFLTPVFWRPDRLGEYAYLIDYNPFYHCLEIVRAPLVSGGGVLDHYAVVGAIAAVTSVVSFCLYAAFFRRLPYWC